MTAFSALKTAVSRDLRDPSNVTFDATTVGDLINAGLAEIGRVAPFSFQDDITLVADTLSYKLRAAGAAAAIPEVEVMSVELWDATTTPHTPKRMIAPASGAYINFSDTGWRVWGGYLQVPSWVPAYVKGSESHYVLRVWGYSPYTQLSADADIVPVSNELEWALRSYCKVAALERLVAERDLFSQWQIRSSNTDVSPAALMNALSLAQADWRRTKREIAVLRVGS